MITYNWNTITTEHTVVFVLARFPKLLVLRVYPAQRYI